MKKILFTACATLVASAAIAHHSGAMFDSTKQIEYTGTVKEFQYTNPHSWLMVNVKGEDGKEVLWGFEAEGPSTLKQAGIERSTFKPGETVTVLASPMKDGRPAGAWRRVTTVADGKVYGARPAPPPAAK
jgi:hypothetical protein